MEYPITVIVVLVVALAVGIGVISFSDQLLTNSKGNLNQLTVPEISDETGIVRLDTVSVEDVKRLSEECVSASLGHAGGYLCFVLSGDISSATVSDIRALDGSLINNPSRELTYAVEVSDTVTAVFIAYDPLGHITITS